MIRTLGHVFISYSSRHRALTRDFAALLEQAGFPVWWDRELEAWGEYEPQIREAIDAAAAVVVIWSDGAVKSRFVKSEVEKAMRLGRLVNLRAPDFPLDEVPLNYAAVDHIQTLDLDDPATILKSLRTVWEGKVPAGARPIREFYREQYDEDLFDPRRRPLPDDAAMVTPSVLLQAPFEVAGYVDATGILADTLEWCRGTGAHAEAARPNAGRLLHGPGGLGKTRTMIEALRQLRGDGWLAGFYPALVPSDQARMKLRHRAIEQTLATPDLPGILMVLDYAETRSTDVVELSVMARRHDREGLPPLRIVLLSRGDGWWQDIYRTEPEVQVVFNRRGAPQGDVIAVEPLPAGEARLAAFDAMRAALTPMLAQQAEAGRFPPLTDQPVPPNRRARLAEEPAYARPLALQMEALLSLGGEDGRAVADLLESILGLERRHWRRVIDGLAPDDRREIAMRRGMSQITALGGVADRRGLQRLLRADEYFGPRAPVDLPIAELRRLYGAAPEGVAPLEPDLIGEHEVLLSGDEDLLDACRAWIASQPEADRSLRRRSLFTLLQRAARAEHGARVAEAEALLSHPVANLTVEEVPDLIAVAIETPGPLAALLTAQVPELPAEVLHSLIAALPEQTVALTELAKVAAERRLEEAKAAVSLEESDERLSGLARSLQEYGKRLHFLGLHAEARDASEQAISIYRRLVEARPNLFEADLALALGETTRALTQRPFDVISRRLAVGDINRRDQKGRGKPRALNVVSQLFIDALDREKALTAMKEAVIIQEKLSVGGAENHRRDLAKSLMTLGEVLHGLNWRKEAVHFTKRAAKLLGELLESSCSEGREASLADCLMNLGPQLYDIGKGEKALEAVKSATAIYRRLAAARPDFFEPRLANSLFILWAISIRLGNYELSISTIEEEVSVLKRLAERLPDIFEPQLSDGLDTLQIAYAALGHREKAIAAKEEEVTVRRRVASAHPETVDRLAGSLKELSDLQVKMKRWERALTATKEEVSLYRSATKRNSAYRRPLARSLGRLDVLLARGGRHGSALVAREEAVAIHRRLAAEPPGEAKTALAYSLDRLAALYWQCNRPEEAATTAEEGIGLLTPYHARDPATHQKVMDKLKDTLAKTAAKGNGEAR